MGAGLLIIAHRSKKWSLSTLLLALIVLATLAHGYREQEKERPVVCKILPTHVITLDAKRKEGEQR